MSYLLGFIMDKRAEREVKNLMEKYYQKKFRDDLFSTLMDRTIPIFIAETLQKQVNFFDYFDQPRSLQDIVEHFEVKDLAYTQLFLDAFVNTKLLEKNNDKYLKTTVFKQKMQNPAPEYKLFEVMPTLKNAYTFFIGAVLPRMRGEYTQFLPTPRPYVWDAVLSSEDYYEQLRYATLLFGGAFRRQGKFLDLGCGNAWGTVNIWYYYYTRGYFDGSKKMIQFYGVDPTEALLNAAQTGFKYWLSQRAGISQEKIDKEYSNTIPEFKKGTAHEIPYPDNFFDIVYISQALHWDDQELGYKEMFRVVKPGGLVVGNEVYNQFADLIVRTVKGSGGVAPAKEHERMLKNIHGAKDIRVLSYDSWIYFRYSK